MSGGPEKQQKRQRSSLSAAGAVAVNQLGFQLLEQLEAEQPPRNLFLCPASLAFGLAIAANGAAGRTRAALVSVLGMQGLDDKELNERFRRLRAAVEQPGPQLELNFASAVWGPMAVNLAADFLQRIQEFYAADARTLDAEGRAAAEVINGWVSSKTNGRITILVNADDVSSAACVLTTAAYFKGLWSTPFSPGATRDMPFKLLDGRRKDVAMMRRSGAYSYLETTQFQAIALDYTAGSLSMYVFLPREGASLRRADWEAWAPQFRTTQVELTLPRFSVTSGLDLVDTLSELGLRKVFTPGADFSRMGLAGYFITAIKHKARVDVTEEGTEAAASSAVVMGRSLTQTTSMLVDRPFMLAIVHRQTGLLLFLGRVIEPEPGQAADQATSS